MWSTHTPAERKLVFWSEPWLKPHVGVRVGQGGSEKCIWKIFYRGHPKIGTPGTPRGSHGTKFFCWNFFSQRVIWVYVCSFGVIIIKKWFLAQEWVFRAIIEEAFKNDSSWLKNNFFITINPKPTYIHPNNFLRKKFTRKIFGPMGPLWGTWGPYLGIPSVEYFPNVFFWTTWTPLASPYLQMQWRPPKNLKNFQGAVSHKTILKGMRNIITLDAKPYRFFSN